MRLTRLAFVRFASALVAVAGVGGLSEAKAQTIVLLDYDQYDLTQSMSPSSDLIMAATLRDTSRPLLSALDQRFRSINQLAPVPSPQQLTSVFLQAAEGQGVQPSSNVWFAASQGWLRNNAHLVDYAGDQMAFTVGADHRITPDLVLGMAASRDELNLSTYFNQGRLTSDGDTLSPYLVWNVSGPFSVDATAAVTRSRIKQTYALDLDPNGTRASVKAYRGMFAGNLNYTTFLDTWVVGAKLGTLNLSERVGSFVDTAGFAYPHRTNTLGQMQAGGNVGRVLTWGSFSASAAYLYDYNHLETVGLPGEPPPSIDRDGVLLGANVSANVGSGVALNVALSREFLRDNVHNTNVTAMLAVSF